MDLGAQIYATLKHTTTDWNTLGKQQVPSAGKRNQNHKGTESSRAAASDMCQ